MNITEYREFVANNLPPDPPDPLPKNEEELKALLNTWEEFEELLVPPTGYRTDNELFYFNTIGIHKVRIGRVHIRNIKRAINRLKTESREHTKDIVKTSVIIPRTTKEMLYIFPYKTIQSIIENINISKASVKSPIDTPFYPPPSLPKSSFSSKRTSKSIAKNLSKDKLIDIIMQQPDYKLHIERTLHHLSASDTNKTIKFFEELGFGEFFPKGMKLPEKKRTLLLVFNKFSDINPKKIPLSVAMKIENFLGRSIRSGVRKRKENETKKIKRKENETKKNIKLK